MHRVLTSSRHGQELSPDMIDGMFRLRDAVFNKRLGWEVTSEDGRERDRFDDLEPIYMLAVREDRQVEGCWRLLPTDSSYMLRDTFPVLLRGEEAPRHRRIWELSRFAVSCGGAASNVAQVNMNEVTYAMIRTVYDFAVENDIEEYVTVTSVALERLLKRIGIPLIRFGDGASTRIGKVRSVACRVPIDERFRAVVYPAVAAASCSRLRVDAEDLAVA